MTQALIRYNENNVLRSELTGIKFIILRLITEAVSTENIPLVASSDVELIFESHSPGSIANDISIELKTIGYPERRKKLTEERILKLKRDLLEAGLKKWMGDEIPLIWLQFTDGVLV